MRRRFTLAVLCLAALSLFWQVPRALADDAFSVNAKLTLLGILGPNGEQRYRFDYTVTNNSIIPDLGSFQVFFNSDPVTQEPTGDKATLVSYGSPAGWEFVDVYPKNELGQWALNWNWDYGTGLDVVPGQSLSGFSVVFDWSDPNSVPPVQLAQARDGSAHDGVTRIELSSIAGTVTGTCGCTTKGLLGVTVDLYAIDGSGGEALVASTATDADGAYVFGGLGFGQYEVSIVMPLDYSADSSSVMIDVAESGASVEADFALRCEPVCRHPRTLCWWQHEVNFHRCHRGPHEVTVNELLGYIDLILTHFNENITNPVIIYVPDSNDPADQLKRLDQLLNLNRCGSFTDLAKRELLALLLNVVSGKISQNTVIQSNGATVSQAITYCNDLILLGDRSSGVKAALIAGIINMGLNVPCNLVPADTRMVTYRSHPTAEGNVAFGLAAAAPNPSRGGPVSIGFSLARPDRVDLRLFDVTGRMVRSLASGSFAAGQHRVTWDGTREDGARVQPGVYFYRLVTEEGTLTRSVALQR